MKCFILRGSSCVCNSIIWGGISNDVIASSTSTHSLRILVADDHEVFRRGLRSLLESRADWEICGEASNGLEALEKALQLKPDVVVLDINMPGLNGLETTRLIRQQLPAAEIVVV